MNDKVIIAVVIVAIVLVGGYFLLNVNREPVSMMNGQTDLSNSTNNMSGNMTQANMDKMMSHEVIYTDSGYSPKDLTVKVGDTVTWKNESSVGMWTASGMHPSHVIYSGTSLDEHCPDRQNASFDECTSAQPGQSWSFKFDKKGKWYYHDHVHASNFGSVTVQ